MNLQEHPRINSVLIAALLKMVNVAPQKTPEASLGNNPQHTIVMTNMHARRSFEDPRAHNQLPVVIVITWVELLALIQASFK